MTEFTPLSSLLGGALLGLASLLFLLLNGRIAGISSIISGSFRALNRTPQWRWCFLLGLALSPLALAIFDYQNISSIEITWPLTITGGFLVGFGSYLGSGCTSGHGICGIGRLSPRSIVSTCVFMLVAIAVVFISKHLL
jgi:uncharacterized membrane protein YedE/YeeE